MDLLSLGSPHRQGGTGFVVDVTARVPPFLQDVAGTGTASMTITGTAYRYLVSESIELVEPGRQVNVTLWFYDFDKAPAITPPG